MLREKKKRFLSFLEFACKFHQYLYGCTFTLVTEHKLLTTILGPKKGILALSAARMQRWALLLSTYTYDIHFPPTQSHGNADGLSCLPVREVQSCMPDDAMVFNIAQLDALPVCSSELMVATRTDPQLSKILQYVRKGWLEKILGTLFPLLAETKRVDCGGRFDIVGCSCGVISTKLRHRVLEELHRGHLGVVRMKALARSHVWWPELDRDQVKIK